MIDTAVVVVSELVTNAIAAYRRAQPRHGESAAAFRIAVRLTYSYHDVIVEVWDGAAGRPTRRAADSDAEDGRGLHLVTALTRKSGHCQVRIRTADGSCRTNGKVVWAVLPHDTPPVRLVPDAPAEDLPRRDPSPSRAGSTPTPDVVDLALLQRVIDRLRTLDD